VTVTHFLILGLGVFFVWDCAGRIVVAMATALLPEVVRSPVRYVAVLALAWDANRYAPDWLAVPAATAALVGFAEQLVATLRHSSEREISTMRVRRRAGGGSSGFPWP
jgi:hypothetical protein